MHEGAARRAPHRVTDADHGIDRTAPQRMLCHPPILRPALAWTVQIVEAAGVLMLLLTAALLWPRRSAPRSAGG